MSFVYHKVPHNRVGSVLYPLAQLKTKHPPIFDLESAKYYDDPRRDIPGSRIPMLECAWNEVLFFSPVHPDRIRNAYREVGLSVSMTSMWYEIPTEILAPSLTAVWLGIGNSTDPDTYVPYDPEGLDQFRTIPQATLDYYREEHERGERPFIYFGIPHVLFRGSLDVSNLLTV